MWAIYRRAALCCAAACCSVGLAAAQTDHASALDAYSDQGPIALEIPEGNDPDSLGRWAQSRQLFDGAAVPFERWGAATADEKVRRQALDAGFFLALRDHDLQAAARIRQSLVNAGGEDLSWWIPEPPPPSSEEIEIIGGLEALSLIARSRKVTTSEEFFEHYCRAISRIADLASKESAELQLENIRSYFEVVHQLAYYQDVRGERSISVFLSVGDADNVRRSRRILSWIGWDLKKNRRGVELSAGDSERDAQGQEYAAALGIDQAALVETLSAGREFELVIPVGRAQILLGEPIWREAFYPDVAPTGGFAEAVLDEPRIAEAYVGLAAMAPRAADTLVAGVGLERTVRRYSAPLQLYSGALDISGEGVVIPGGQQASAAWQRLVGEDPRQPSQFLPALLRKDESRILAFFSNLTQLDVAKQRFFTATAQRLLAFYDAFRATPEVSNGTGRLVHGETFGKFLREIPVAQDGSLAFPGSPEIWLVAKGDADVRRLERRLARVSREEEDRILLRLVQTEFDTKGGSKSQMLKFLAAARIDRARLQPLEPSAALQIAQGFAEFGSTYGYLSSLEGLSTQHIERFFQFARTADEGSPVDKNLVLGLFHSTAALLCLADERKLISPEEAARLFGSLVQNLASAAGPAAEVRAALGVIREMVAIRGLDSQQEFELLSRVQGKAEDRLAYRRAEVEQVKRLQHVPSIGDLLEMERAVTALQNGEPPEEHIKRLRSGIAALPKVEIPKGAALPGDLKDSVQSFDPIQIQGDLNRLMRAASRRPPKPIDVKEAAFRVLAALRPQVVLALSGEVYAAYLRPDDLLAASDPLLLRKHHFYDLDAAMTPDLFQIAAVRSSSEAAGSWLQGGFADFPAAIGALTLFNVRDYNASAQFFIQAELGSLRATDWALVSPAHVRLFALSVLTAREWIVQAAKDADLRSELATAMPGIVGPARQAKVLRLLEERRWDPLWDLLTLSDLYYLGERSPERMSESPLRQASARLRQAGKIQDLHPLGAVHASLWGQGYPRLEPAAPYEAFERILRASQIAERTAEWKLYAAWEADRRGIDPRDLGPVLEQAALSVITRSSPSDLYNWRSVIDTYRTYTGPVLEEALPQ